MKHEGELRKEEAMHAPGMHDKRTSGWVARAMNGCSNLLSTPQASIVIPVSPTPLFEKMLAAFYTLIFLGKIVDNNTRRSTSSRAQI